MIKVNKEAQPTLKQHHSLFSWEQTGLVVNKGVTMRLEAMNLKR